MAFLKLKWKDHVVKNPRTFRQTTNSDGTVTQTPAPGEVLQQGTAQSAANFNRLEEGLQGYSAAVDQLVTLVDAMEMEQQIMKEQLEALRG